MTKMLLRRLLQTLLPAIFLIFSSQSKGAELLNFSWNSTSSLPGVTVTCTFSFTIQTAAPNMILYAINNGDGNPFNCSAVGYPLNTSLVDVKINNVSQTIDATGSWGGTGNMAIRLVTPENATAGSEIVITIQNVVNTSVPGVYPWTWIRTADGGGNEIDGAGSPSDIFIGGPAIVVNPASVAFGYVPSGNTSDEMSYNLSGNLLSPSSGNITVTPPDNFEVSLTSGYGFSSSAIDVPYTSGFLSLTPVYVRFKPTNADTPYAGNIYNSGGTADLQNVAVSGTSVFGYCVVTTNQPCCMGINNVTFNTINNTSDNINYIYSDYTALSTNVLKGQTYQLSVNGWGNDQSCYAWFDWNNDGDFDDAGEAFYVGSWALYYNNWITIPINAITGNVRMRIRSEYAYFDAPQACGSVEYGECEDYTINVEPARPTLNVSPSDLAFGFTSPGNTSDEMTYTLSGYDLSPAEGNLTIVPPDNFEVSLTSGSGFSSSALYIPYSSGTLSEITLYVRFKPLGSSAYSGNISNSGGNAAAQYVAVTGTSICSAGTNNTSYMGIQEVIFNTIDNSTGTTNQGYNDFTSISTDVEKGQSYTLSVYGWGYYQYFMVWFDWNNDGDFDDAGEEFSLGAYAYETSVPIEIPLSASTGNIRMRVRSNYQGSPLPQACGAVDYGECEDYTINTGSGAIVWTGSVDTYWNNTGNWSTNAVPTSSDNVLIPDVTNEPVVNLAPGTPAVCNNLTIESGAVVTIAAGKALTVAGILTNDAGYTGLDVESGGSLISGTSDISAIIKCTIPANQWHLIAASTSNATSGIFYGHYLQTHSEATNAYTDITDRGVELTPMKGYALWGDLDPEEVTFVGPLNAGSYSFNTTKLGAGWNLVGNPYPSSIDWDASSGWTKSGIDNAIYLHVNTATFATYVGGVATNGGSQYIAPGQGFFVKASTDGTLAMTNAVRVHNPTAFFKNSGVVPNLVRLEVSGNNYRDEAVIRFLPGATAGFDGDYDALKLYGDEAEAAQIYSSENIPLAINTLPETNMVPVGIKAGVSGTYTISATEINDLQYIKLEDTQTGIFTELAKGAYTFYSYAGENEHRFKLHFSALGINDNQVETATIYSNNKTVFINLNDRQRGDISIFDISGQLVASMPSAQGYTSIKLETDGLYFVKVIMDKTTIVKKVLVK